MRKRINSLKYALCISVIGCAMAQPARANNEAVESAIKSRSDLSSFYQALLNTGVLSELQPNEHYTIFAPTNAAFSAMVRAEYPCFDSVQCKDEMAAIMRNHIVAGKLSITDLAQHQGGYFSIGQKHIPIGEPTRGDYAVEGQDIIGQTGFDGNMLYTIDGVIASPRQQIALPLMSEAAQPQVSTTVETHTIPYPPCGPAGCPDRSTKTTTIKHYAVVPAPSSDSNSASDHSAPNAE